MVVLGALPWAPPLFRFRFPVWLEDSTPSTQVRLNIEADRRLSASTIYPDSLSLLQRDPYQHDHHVEPLRLTAIVLVAPHAIRLLVPVRTRCAVHTSAADVGLAVGGGRCAGRGSLVLGLLGRGACRGGGALGLVELRGRDEVLHDRAVDGVLVFGGRGVVGRRLGDDGAENVVLADVANSC